ncbi:hypothetical protein AAJCM20276_05010 [Acetobacter aceti]|uniref:Uncharacterized protein n=1 Tax=Acetobacter aceti TaxID=435 RepID=A0A6S6PAU2_ACEAC|nr:hypothetical protein [Acetobacter aceti]BCI65877.1 hypothetical protein AAJCM20276_05010 [Acetobacter aceti]
MIIQSSRMETASGFSSTCRHVFHGSGNKEIEVLQGSEFDVMTIFNRASVRDDKYAMRHFKISPKETMTREQMKDVLGMLAYEFGFNPADAIIIEHAKDRADLTAFDRHWHVDVPERLRSGKIMDNRAMRIRQEKISRLSEIKFGHQIVHGRHQEAVIKELENTGRKFLAEKIRQATPDLSHRPKSAFTFAQQRMAERNGISLPDVRQRLKDLRISCDTFSGMIEQMEGMGLHVKKGDKENTYIIVTHDNNFLGSANRLLGMKKQEFSQEYESYVAGMDTKYEPVEGGSSLVVTETAPEKPMERAVNHIPPDGGNKVRPPSEPRKSAQIPVSSGHVHADLANDTSKTTEAMSREEKTAIHAQNADRMQASQTIRKMLADQEEFHRKLLELDKQFQSRWSHIKPEPFPDEKDRNPVIIRERHEGILRPLRDKYLTEKQKWLNGSSTRKALQEFQSALKKLRYDRDDFKALDMANNEKDFSYCLNWMADFYVAGRERTRREWAEDLSVQSYVKAKKDFDDLLNYIKKTGDVTVLETAMKNPVHALQMIRRMKKPEAGSGGSRRSGPSVKISFDR